MSKKEIYLTASQRTTPEAEITGKKEIEKNASAKKAADANSAEEPKDAEGENKKSAGEDALEIHYMSFFGKIRYKFQQYKEKTKDMSPKEHISFFVYYYKWPVLLTVGLIICICTLSRQIYINSRPMAIGIAILNNSYDEKQLLAKQIEEDYRNYYPFKDSDRFVILENMEINPETYYNDLVSTNSGTITAYENLYYQISGDSLDVIITDEKGILYCVEQDLVYPLENFLSAEARALYEDDICIYTSYTNQEREYAIDISDTKFAADLDLGYDKVYLLLTSNEEDNKQRIERFIQYIYSQS